MSFALALGAVSFFLAVIWGPPLIQLLRRYHVGKQIRVELPTTHQTKLGTPTMGGLMIVVPVMRVRWNPVDVFVESDRGSGGFGSTGKA